MKLTVTAIRRYVRSLRLPRPPHGLRWVVFDDGRVAFLAPADYATHRERDETIAIYPPGKDSGVTLRFSLHARHLHSETPSDIAEQFVSEQAAKQHLPVTRLSDRLFMTESREADWPDRRVLMHYWQVGAGRILVVCSATLWGADRDSATVRRALTVVPQIIKSLRLT